MTKLVGYIHNGRYIRVEDEDEFNTDSNSNSPSQTRFGTSLDYRPGKYNAQSRAAYDRRDTDDQTSTLFKRDSAKMRGDLDAALRYEKEYHASKREQFRRDPALREEMRREWPHEPEYNLRHPVLR